MQAIAVDYKWSIDEDNDFVWWENLPGILGRSRSRVVVPEPARDALISERLQREKAEARVVELEETLRIARIGVANLAAEVRR